MRYLLDEMYPAAAADAARRRGLDVIAVQEDGELHGLSDVELFGVAQLDERVVVTENARDLLPIEGTWRRDRGPHCGLLLTSNRSFPRHDVAAFIRDLAAALAEMDTRLDAEGASFVRWLGR